MHFLENSATHIDFRQISRISRASGEIPPFFPKDDNLGELMSTVCVARVRGWAGVGACSAEGVGDGPNPAGGRLGHRSRCPEGPNYCHARVSQ